MRTLTIIMYMAVIVAAIAVTWNAVGGPARSNSLARQAPAGEEHWMGWEELRRLGPVKGPDEAPVVILEFVDYQCAFCQMLAPVLDSLRAVFPREIQIVSIPFPLHQHRFAEITAVAAGCAASQERFTGMYSALFALKDSIGLLEWDAVAERAGITDMDRFKSCMASEDAYSAVKEASLVGRAAGVTGTPTIVINGRRLRSRFDYEGLHQAIESAIAGDSPPVSDTVDVTPRSSSVGASPL